MDLPHDIVLYYIDPIDGDVYRQSLGSADRTHVYDLNATSRAARLAIVTDQVDGPEWRIAAVLAEGPAESTVTVKEASPGEVAALEWVTWPDQDRPGKGYKFRDTHWNFGRAPRLGAAKDSQWQFETEFWGHVYGRRRGKFHSWAVETPFFAWRARNATHLPNDTLLFQLGDNTVVLFDAETEKVAQVVQGRGPVAIIERTD